MALGSFRDKSNESGGRFDWANHLPEARKLAGYIFDIALLFNFEHFKSRKYYEKAEPYDSFDIH